MYLRNIKFTFPDSYSVVYEVEGWRCYQGHGHDIKSWQSIPFYGICSRTATGLNALRVANGTPIPLLPSSRTSTTLAAFARLGLSISSNGSLIGGGGGTEFSVNGSGSIRSTVPVVAGCAQGSRDHSQMADSS